MADYIQAMQPVSVKSLTKTGISCLWNVCHQPMPDIKNYQSVRDDNIILL
jgi:hypothetical protein